MAAVTLHHFSGLAAPFVRSTRTVSGNVFRSWYKSGYEFQNTLSLRMIFSIESPMLVGQIYRCDTAFLGERNNLPLSAFFFITFLSSSFWAQASWKSPLFSAFFALSVGRFTSPSIQFSSNVTSNGHFTFWMIHFVRSTKSRSNSFICIFNVPPHCPTCFIPTILLCFQDFVNLQKFTKSFLCSL